jgi:hypothetical protein
MSVAAGIVKTLSDLNLDESDCVVLDLFSNDIYIGTDSKGYGSLPFNDQDGWHEEGALDVMPLKALRIIAKMAADICGVAGSAKVLVALPLPRYVIAACCTSQRHVTNLDEADYESVLLAGSHVVKSVLEEELEGLSRQPVIFNPLASFNGDGLRHTSSSNSNIIWPEADPVHLTEAAYKEIVPLHYQHVEERRGRRTPQDRKHHRGGEEGQHQRRRPRTRRAGEAADCGEAAGGNGWGQSGPPDYRFAPY